MNAALYLLVHPNGGKYWRLKYRFAGAEKLLALGTYPDLGLKDARQRRDDAPASCWPPAKTRALNARQKKLDYCKARQAPSRSLLGNGSTNVSSTWAPTHAKTVIRRLERDAFPWIGNRAISEITPAELWLKPRVNLPNHKTPAGIGSMGVQQPPSAWIAGGLTIRMLGRFAATGIGWPTSEPGVRCTN